MGSRLQHDWTVEDYAIHHAYLRQAVQMQIDRLQEANGDCARRRAMQTTAMKGLGMTVKRCVAKRLSQLRELDRRLQLDLHLVGHHAYVWHIVCIMEWFKRLQVLELHQHDMLVCGVPENAESLTDRALQLSAAEVPASVPIFHGDALVAVAPVDQNVRDEGDEVPVPALLNGHEADDTWSVIDGMSSCGSEAD